jgi:hypothetical protein
MIEPIEKKLPSRPPFQCLPCHRRGMLLEHERETPVIDPTRRSIPLDTTRERLYILISRKQIYVGLAAMNKTL